MFRKNDGLVQGRPTRGARATFSPRKGFEWPAEYFLKSSVPPILAEIQPEIEDRFHVQTSFYPVFSEIASFHRKS